MSEESEKRIAPRLPVLKGAKAHFDRAVVDCLVLDFSAQGARIGTEGFVAFPDRFILELRTGSRWEATRRWQRGTEVGLAFTDFAGLSLEARSKAAECLRDLRHSGVRSVLVALEQARYFDYPALRAAAERLEEADLALTAMIQEAVERQ